MYTILMDVNKSLITPKKITIYQGENLIDTLRIIIPKQYNNIDISEYSVLLNYILPGNVKCNETLKKIEEEYSDTHNAYTLSVNSNFTTFAGDITLSLLISKTDKENKIKYQLLTGDLTITIKPRELFYGTNTSGGITPTPPDPSEGDDEFDVVEF